MSTWRPRDPTTSAAVTALPRSVRNRVDSGYRWTPMWPAVNPTIGIPIVGRSTVREASPRLQRNAACEGAWVTSTRGTCAAGPTKQVCQTQASSRPPGTLSLRWAESGTQAVGAKSPRKRWQRRARRASAQLLRQHCPECASDVRLLPSGGYSDAVEFHTRTSISCAAKPVQPATFGDASVCDGSSPNCVR
jgi:hypothetical protein